MARLVRPRKSPTLMYLIVFFVFLFVIATVLAILGYMELNQARKDLAALEESNRKLASDDELKNPRIAKLMQDFGEQKQGRRYTVVGHLYKQVNDLSHMITGQLGAYGEAVSEYKSVRAEVKDSRGLATMAKAFHAQIDATNNSLKDLRSRLAAERKQTLQKQAMLESVSKRHKQASAALKGKISRLDAKFQQEQKHHTKRVEKLRADYTRQVEDLNRRIANLTKKLQEQQLDKQRLEDVARRLQKQIRVLRTPGTTDVAAARKADGKIMKMLENDNICYIDLGAKDRIVPGLTFSVYPETGIPKEGEGKAKIIVTNVSENISECRIVEQKRSDPIIEGDLVANVVFDRLQRHKFVVEGQFDLHGQGRATSVGTEEVKLLIKKFGGTISEEVAIDTDFVIMGTEPSLPPKPDEDAEPTVRRVWEEQKKLVDQYNTVKLLAKSMYVPILNSNRFLALMGHSPSVSTQAR